MLNKRFENGVVVCSIDSVDASGALSSCFQNIDPACGGSVAVAGARRDAPVVSQQPQLPPSAAATPSVSSVSSSGTGEAGEIPAVSPSSSGGGGSAPVPALTAGGRALNVLADFSRGLEPDSRAQCARSIISVAYVPLFVHIPSQYEWGSASGGGGGGGA